MQNLCATRYNFRAESFRARAQLCNYTNCDLCPTIISPVDPDASGLSESGCLSDPRGV